MNARLPGLLLIAIGATGAVRDYLQLCRDRVRTLSALGAMLELMQGELESSALPMGQLLEAIEKRLDEPALYFAVQVREGLKELGRHSFQEIWCEGLRLCLPQLGGPEREALAQLGAVLGRYELPRQLEALSVCRETLRRQEQQERGAMSDRVRLAVGLGLTGTALLWIVLI